MEKATKVPTERKLKNMVQRDFEEQRKVIVLTGMIGLGSLTLFLFAFLSFRAGDITRAIADIVLGVTTLAILFAIHRGFSVIKAGTIVSTLFMLFILFLSTQGFKEGGYYNFWWTVSFSTVSIFFLGYKRGGLFTLSFFVLLGVILFAPGVGELFGKHRPDSLFVSRLIGVNILIAGLVAIFDLARDRIQKELHQTNLQLSKTTSELQSRKKQSDAIFQNVRDGLFLISSEYKISAEHSASLENIFNLENISEKDFFSLFNESLTYKEMGSFKDFIEMFFVDDPNIELLETINPVEQVKMNLMTKDGTLVVKHLAFSFSPILSETEPMVLVSVRDRTDEVNLENRIKLEEDKRKKEMESLFQILHLDSIMLREFIEQTEAELEAVNDILKSKEENFGVVVNSIFQSIHAIKGDAGLLGLSNFASKLHEIEDVLVKLRELKTSQWKDLLGTTFSLVEIKRELTEISELIKKIETFKGTLTTSKAPKEDVYIRSLDRLCHRISNQFGKEVILNTAKFDISKIEGDLKKPIKDILVQFTRNALVHGVEAPEERIKVKKLKVGEIKLSSKKQAKS